MVLYQVMLYCIKSYHILYSIIYISIKSHILYVYIYTLYYIILYYIVLYYIILYYIYIWLWVYEEKTKKLELYSGWDRSPTGGCWENLSEMIMAMWYNQTLW